MKKTQIQSFLLNNITLHISVYDIEKDGFRCKENPVLEFPPKILESSYNAVLFVKNNIDYTTKEQLVLHYKSIFLQFYCQLLHNYKDYFLVDPRSSREIAQNLFDIDRYMNEAPEDSIEFLREFSKTQSFNNFIEHTFSFHKEGIDIWNQKSDGKLTTIKCSLNKIFHIYKQEMDAINNVTTTPKKLIEHIEEEKIFCPEKVLPLPILNLKKPGSMLLKKEIFLRKGSNIHKASSLSQTLNPSISNRKCAKIVGPTEDEIIIEDPSIAEELNDNDEPIFRDLARRESRKENQMEKIKQAMDQLPKRPDCLMKQFERLRSFSHYPPKSRFNCTSILPSKHKI